MSMKLPKEIKTVVYIGTHKISVFAGQVFDGEPKILSYREKFQPEGFENGLVVNMEAAVTSVESLISEIYPKAGNRQLKVYVVLGNAKLSAYSFSSAQYYASQRTLSSHEVRTVIEQTRSVATLPLTEFVLQVIPESFLVNDIDNIRNPLGLEATRLGVNLKIFTMDFQDFRNLSKAFEAADIHVNGYWPRMLTVSEAVLNEQEKEEGVILVDIADHITQLVLWKNKRLVKVRPVEKAGKQLTAMIAQEWQIDFHDAQKVKERFATLEEEHEFGDELIPLVSRNGRAAGRVRRQEFQQKFVELSAGWLGDILREVDHLAGEEKLIYPHLVFSGGGVSFSGFLEFFNRRFEREARMGMMRNFDAPHEALVDPSLAAVHGMYRWLSGHGQEYASLVTPGNFLERTLASAKEWFYDYF